jgi:hypothetical protein
MILRLLLMTGYHLHKKNLHIVWLWWLPLASNLQTRKGLHKHTVMHQ